MFGVDAFITNRGDLSLNKHKHTKNSSNLADILVMKSAQINGLVRREHMLHFNCAGELAIENCKAILMYTDSEIRLDMGIIVSLKGDGLMMQSADKDQITVRGRFFSVEFCYGGGR